MSLSFSRQYKRTLKLKKIKPVLNYFRQINFYKLSSLQHLVASITSTRGLHRPRTHAHCCLSLTTSSTRSSETRQLLRPPTTWCVKYSLAIISGGSVWTKFDAPPGPIVLISVQFSGKIDHTICWCPPLWGWLTPPLENPGFSPDRSKPYVALFFILTPETASKQNPKVP